MVSADHGLSTAYWGLSRTLHIVCIIAALSAPYLKHLFWADSSDNVNTINVKAKNAQIGDEVFVDGIPVYHDAKGAPVETVSPLGYHVGWAGILFLNVSQMVGTGVFSTRELSS
jgi:hypothetical protein